MAFKQRRIHVNATSCRCIDVDATLSQRCVPAWKCQIMFSGRNKKNIINLSSAEFAHRVVNVKKMEKKNIRFTKTLSGTLRSVLLTIVASRTLPFSD